MSLLYETYMSSYTCIISAGLLLGGLTLGYGETLPNLQLNRSLSIHSLSHRLTNYTFLEEDLGEYLFQEDLQETHISHRGSGRECPGATCNSNG